MKTRGRLVAWGGQGGLRSRSPPLPPPLWRAGRPGRSGSAGLVFSTARGMGWPHQGWGPQLEGLWSQQEPLPPFTPQACPFKATKCRLGGEKTQIRRRPGGSEPGCGLAQGVRRRELKPDGCLWPAPSKKAARPFTQTGPASPARPPWGPATCPSAGSDSHQDGGRGGLAAQDWVRDRGQVWGDITEPWPILSTFYTPARSYTANT